ncbi:MAG: hypothetical protein QXT19_01690 [Candidatus Woesearchaeota archaeon]
MGVTNMAENIEEEAKKTSEELKRIAPTVKGLELEKIIKKRKPMEPNPEILIFVPFAEKTDLKPADAYKKYVEEIAKKGIDEKYLLLASIRKLSEKYNSATILDLKHYTHTGLTEDIIKDKEKTKEFLKNRFEENKETLEKIVKNADKAWEDPETPAVVTPPHAREAYEDATNTLPDDEGTFLQKSGVLQRFIAENGSKKDQRHCIEGSRFYVAHYKKAKNDEGEERLVLDYVEVWKKKE